MVQIGRYAYRDGHNNVCETESSQSAKRLFWFWRWKTLSTLMTIKDLHDFPALQVPQVYLAVFAARHDPFSAGDAEASGDAVLGILVADVGLQAARGLEVPQSYRAVVRGGEDIL